MANVNKIQGNMKLSTMIIIEVVIAMILVITQGIVSIANSQKTIRDSREISAITARSTEYINKIRTDMLEMRIQVVKGTLGEYEPQMYNIIKEKNENISDSVNSYLKLGIVSQAEKDALADVTNKVDIYNKTWDGIRAGILNGKIAPIEQRNALKDAAEEVDASLAKADKANLITLKANNVIIDKSMKDSKNLIFSIMLCVMFVLGISSVFLVWSMKKSIKEFAYILERVSKLDLSVKITPDKSEFGQMKKLVKAALNDISRVIRDVIDSAHSVEDKSTSLKVASGQITSATAEVSGAMQEIAAGSNVQAAKLQEINATMDIFSQNIKSITESITDVDKSTEDAMGSAKESSTQLENIVLSINEIKHSFEDVSDKVSILSSNIVRVSDITNLINSIAEQTNLLALNAAIEAARAGESGRGFAVVSDEVRKLAEQSKDSVKDINKLIETVTLESKVMEETTENVGKELESEIDKIQESIDSFRLTINSIEAIAPKVELVGAKIEELNSDKVEIVERVNEISSISQEFTGAAEEIAASSEEVTSSTEEVEGAAIDLQEKSLSMLNMVNKFTLSE
ncbi:methyl-accepting chemotaxis protein [Clostridium cylindrosporum]|uniref:Methyl-accepting chemotaxis sensory transducer n=1 Tax=Clostridium cylindrosporum DSM 605 TaxID=1121307 RepID=A0A0J8G455_CLOCY|nr:methyl-accepting chemotaxis protein [Clostridium cylindrosporum]KMT22476.1 methyl-accepting chemotaxis sensory transducer [Clostridium cylindrosporum DSM 605]